MEILFLTLLFLSAFCLLHTYWLYPRLVIWLAYRKDAPASPAPVSDPYFVSVLMAVHNEEKVIAKKMETLLRLHFPPQQLRIFIGSDRSTDATNDILKDYQAREERIYFFAYPDRSGKPGVINRLYSEATKHRAASANHLLLITDANVMLHQDCLLRLSRHFQDEAVAIVDAHMQHVGLQAKGISRSEDRYLSGEVRLKHAEGVLWGTMIGPFGGCYLLRSDYYSEVPPNFLVDDFYIAMRAFERGGKAINDLDAICYEAVSHDWKEEFRRKARISTGNYQNLVTFRHLWWPPVRPLPFAFFSHKVLRWWGPFFLLAFLGASLVLWVFFNNYLYGLLFLCVIVFFFALPLADLLLRKWGVQWQLARNIRYFFLMNLALLAGFFRYTKGVKNNVWEPPKRPQLPT